MKKKFAIWALAACTGICLAFLLCIGPALAGQDQYVLIRTSKGPLLLRIYYSAVPYTAGNFLELVEKGFYDGLTFHRVEDWVVQGGDPNGNGTGNYIDPETGAPRYIKLQVDQRLTHNQAGMVAMARGSDRNSASCQFYILKRPMPQLNGQYAVFGRVVKGLANAQAMRRGDRIISAQIVDPAPYLSPGGGSGGGSSGGGYSASPSSAVPGVPDPPQKPVAPSPTGDAGF